MMNKQRLTLASKQRGEGIGGIVAMVIVFVMTLKIGVAIVPAKIADFQLDKSIAVELKKANDNKEPAKRLLSSIQRQLELNAMYDVKVDEMYTVNGKTGNLSIYKKYEVENNFLPGVFITNKFEGEIKPAGSDE